MDKLEFERLKGYCKSDYQLEKLRLYLKHGTFSGAAAELGISEKNVRLTINTIVALAARAGDSPDEDARGLAPPGFVVKGKSILHDNRTGRNIMTWVKTREDVEARKELLLQEMAEAVDSIRGLAPRAKAPATAQKDLLAVYPYGDPHIGMYAWREDAEADFDLAGAVQLMTTATRDLVSMAPPAASALVVFLGDFFHSDSQDNRTARSGNQLDVDSRWSKVLRVGVNIAVSLIQLALGKHKQVRVVVEIGNHDDHSAVMLAVALDAFFRNQKRVEVDLSPARFHYHRFGANLIGIHHGDLVKPEKLPGIMATDRARDWGQTTHRVWYTGHIHQQNRYDLAGCEVESFRILPPRDAYAQGAGYRSGRSMDCIVRHKQRGEISRHTVHAASLGQ